VCGSGFNEFVDNDHTNDGDLGKTHGGIFLFNASNFDVSGNRLSANNGGIVAQAQQRGCVAANIAQGTGACPSGSTLATNSGTVIHDNEIGMTSGFTGLIVLPHAGVAPYAQVAPSWAAQQFQLIRFDYNAYDGTGYGSNRGTNGNQFDVTTNRFLWGFPSGYSSNPAVIWSWTDKRYLGYGDWQALAGQDRNGALRGS
jgi:parallel beta-helix repeat protein